MVVVWYISISRPHPPKGSAKEAATLLQVVPYILDRSSCFNLRQTFSLS